jgi:hypothetical protein
VTAQAPYRDLAESAWRWVLDQVRWQDGPWIPEEVGIPQQVGEVPDIPLERDGTYVGVGGLAHVLTEIQLFRPWTAEEQTLADAIVERVRGGIADSTDCTYFDGLVSDIAVLTALGASKQAAAAVGRLLELAKPDGWPQTLLGPPTYLPGVRLNDLTLGAAGVLLGALWARRHGVEGAGELSDHAVGVLLAEAEHLPTGTSWPFVAKRFRPGVEGTQMPNLSHGVAGVSAAVALAAAELDRPDLAAAAQSGAEHLVSLGVTDGRGFVVPRYIPSDVTDEDEFTFTWCHGAAGTSLLFLALDRAGVEEVRGLPPLMWHQRSLHSVRTSGLPERLHPGFWDNDGRCCGTAGVGDIFLDSWQRSGDQQDLDFAVRLADALVERAFVDGPHAYWRFTEHRAPEPLLQPRVGWMQGAAGIAAYLFRAGRVLADGSEAKSVPRMETWFALAPAGAEPAVSGSAAPHLGRGQERGGAGPVG